jgi:uncharacterized repeat protein (TIGR03803 family)
MKLSSTLLARLALLAAFSFAPLVAAHAQVVNILYNFQNLTDGEQPFAPLVRGANGNFYGTSTETFKIFEITPQGSMTILHNYGDGGVAQDGSQPFAALVQGSDGAFYGTTFGGGSASQGIIFKLTPQGAYSILHNFADGSVPNDGKNPYGALVQGGDGNFYGTTEAGGSFGSGVVFKMTPQGVLTIIHSFGGDVVDLSGSTAADGTGPQSALIQASDGNFYGTTSGGGPAADGTVFRITPQGAFTTLYSFDGTALNGGSAPQNALIQGTDGNLYGVTSTTIFKITLQGVLTVLHVFNDPGVLNDGFDTIFGSLVQAPDGNFYGTSTAGGSTSATNQSTGSGGLFKITPQGDYTFLHSFGDGTIANDGTAPTGALTVGPNGLLYGTTSLGGSGGTYYGTVFTLNPAAPLITSSTTATGALTVPFSYQVIATNNPTNFTAANLPDGLSIGPTTGLISGTPTTVQSKTVTLTASNASGSCTTTLTITVGAAPTPAITSILTAYGSVGTAFNYTTTASNSPSHFTADAASLTSLSGKGLSLNTTTGAITGTPTSSGTISVNLTATNSHGTGAASSLSIQITVAPPTLSQEYNVLHHFLDGSVADDGSLPESIIQAFDGNFYGTATNSGAIGLGAIFKINAQGVASTFYSFSRSTSNIASPTSLIQAADGNFYGTTQSNHVFKLTQDGELSILHHVDNSGGSLNPLIQGFDGYFYGITTSGSANGGFIFKITPQGALTTLHTFPRGLETTDGYNSLAGLIQGTDGDLYGTSTQGGTAGNGTVFKISTQGVFTLLHSFGVGAVDLNGNPTTDGTDPQAGLLQGSDGNFYGTTWVGGINGAGTVFKMTPQGAVTILHSFADPNATSDGMDPWAPLLQGYDGNFYGTTYYGGSNSDGTVFQITPAGVETILHNFGDASVTNDGINPSISPLIQSSGGNFYGVTTGYSTSSTGGGSVYTIQAMQTPTHVPIYTGAAYQEASVLAPFSFTPKALFGVSGSGNVQTNAVKAPSSGGMMDALVSLFVPQSIRKNYSLTSWSLFETGVGAIPPNTLQPLNLMFDPTSGTISGTPTQGGSFSLTMTPSNVKGAGTAQPVTIYIDVPPDLSGAATASATVGTSFSYQVASTPPAISYNASNLPPGLSFDSTTNLVSGTPTIAGTFVFTTTAYNLSGQGSKDVVLTVTGGSSSAPTITSSTVASGAVGTPFTYHITTAHAATALTALIPPCGLAFDASSGTITGTPNANGSFQIPITATNSSGTNASVLSLTVQPPAAPSIASAITAVAANGLPFFYTIPATGIVSTYTETDALPDGLTFNAATGTITGTPTTNGNTTIHLTVGNGTGSANSALTLKVQTPIDYGSWTTTYGVTGGALGTPYHDGVPNLLKYALDINPGHAATATDRAALPVVSTSGTGSAQVLTITYRENALAGDLAPVVQTCSDLRSWSAADNVTTTQIGSDPTTGDPILQAQVPVTSGRQFIRLNVAQP